MTKETNSMEYLTTMQEVVETTHKDEVNKHLQLGWKLLAVAPGTWQDTNEAHVRYSLGWDKPLPAKKPQPY